MSTKGFTELESFQKKINQEIDDYFNQYKKNTTQNDKKIAQLISEIQNITQDGKRVRSALIYYTYLAFGGKNSKNIINLSMFIEFLHTYFLIHDDIMDQDNIRRGKETIHFKYKKIYQKIKTNNHAEIYGQSIAILAGDLASMMSYDIINKSDFNDKTKKKIIDKTNEITHNTIAGQFYDLNLEIAPKISKKDILNVYIKKTAQYTIEGPMILGAIIASKGNKQNLDLIKQFAIPLGIAFQIQDDILGIFGDEKKLGKPIGSDIKENKQTILTWYAYSLANDSQKKILDSCLGNQNLTAKDLENFRQVILETKSLEYAKKEAEKLSENSLKLLEKTKLQPSGKNFLINITKYLISRNH
jgi:geranylgeranyl diphosphate synthase type I